MVIRFEDSDGELLLEAVIPDSEPTPELIRHGTCNWRFHLGYGEDDRIWAVYRPATTYNLMHASVITRLGTEQEGRL